MPRPDSSRFLSSGGRRDVSVFFSLAPFLASSSPHPNLSFCLRLLLPPTPRNPFAHLSLRLMARIVHDPLPERLCPQRLCRKAPAADPLSSKNALASPPLASHEMILFFMFFYLIRTDRTLPLLFDLTIASSRFF